MRCSTTELSWHPCAEDINPNLYPPELHRHCQFYSISQKIERIPNGQSRKLMADSISKKNSNIPPKKRQTLDPELYKRLKSEVKSPYKGLRQFIYLAFGISGLIGALVFFTQLAAGREIASSLPNLALQIGLVALTIWLFRQENKT
jgi:hypothetical protein